MACENWIVGRVENGCLRVIEQDDFAVARDVAVVLLKESKFRSVILAWGNPFRASTGTCLSRTWDFRGNVTHYHITDAEARDAVRAFYADDVELVEAEKVPQM